MTLINGTHNPAPRQPRQTAASSNNPTQIETPTEPVRDPDK